MITNGFNSKVLEKNETNNINAAGNTDIEINKQSTYKNERSVSDDLMMNYAQRGVMKENLLNDEYVSEHNDVYGDLSSDIEDMSRPSQTTMQFQHFEEEEQERETNKSYKINSQGKIMIAIYAIVVATIIALIAINAKVLKNMERSISQKETAVETLIRQTQLLNEELEYVSSEEVITEKALELGMSR